MSKDDSMTFHHFVEDKRIYSHSVFVERRYTHVVIVTDVRNVSSLHAYSDGNGCGRPVEGKPLDHQVYHNCYYFLISSTPMQNGKHHFNYKNI